MVAIVVSILVGVLVGVLSGMLGIGGGVVMVPVFRLGFGMQAIEATATSLFTIVPTSIAGVVTHMRNKTCIPKIGIATGVGGACTSPVGVLLASASPAWLIMLAAAAVIVYSAVTMLRKALAASEEPPAGRGAGQAVPVSLRDGDGDGEGEGAQETADGEPSLEGRPASAGTRCVSKRDAAIGAAIGLVAGLMSGYVGVGGGFIMVPLFISLLGVSMKQASGTSLVAVCILAVPGVVEQLVLGNVMVATGLAMAVGSIPGAVLGANLTRYVPERQLKLFFAALLVFAAVMLLVNEI